MQIRVQKKAIVTEKSLIHKWAIEQQEKPRGKWAIICIDGKYYYDSSKEASLALNHLIFGKK